MGTKGWGAGEDLSQSQCMDLWGLFPKEVLSFRCSCECGFSRSEILRRPSLKLRSLLDTLPTLCCQKKGPRGPVNQAPDPTCLTSLLAAPRPSCLQLDP